MDTSSNTLPSPDLGTEYLGQHERQKRAEETSRRWFFWVPLCVYLGTIFNVGIATWVLTLLSHDELTFMDSRAIISFWGALGVGVSVALTLHGAFRCRRDPWATAGRVLVLLLIELLTTFFFLWLIGVSNAQAVALAQPEVVGRSVR